MTDQIEAALAKLRQDPYAHTGDEHRLLPGWRWRPGLEVTRELATRLSAG